MYSFNVWMKNQKTWQPRDKPFFSTLNAQCHRVTIIGAISPALTRPVFLAANSTNAKDFRKFLTELKTAVHPAFAGPRKPKICVMLGK